MDRRGCWEDLAAHYTALLKEQVESGLSGTDFAEQAEVSAATLYSWRRRLRGQGEVTRLLEVDVVGSGEDEVREVLAVLVGRFRIEVPSGFDEGALSRLVGALERC